MYGAANGPYNAPPVTTAPDSPSVKSRGYNPQIDDSEEFPARPELVNVEFPRIRAAMAPGSNFDPATDLYDEEGVKPAFKRTITYVYFYGNCFYVAYSILLRLIDENPYHWELKKVNDLYLLSNILHLVSAFFYIWMWKQEGFSWAHWILIPDYLNVVEATIYVITSSYYNDMDSATYTDSLTHRVQNAEFAAAWVELFAAIGWNLQWALTYRRVPGRGWTFDDPDIWANVTIFVPSVMYVVYYWQILADRSTYGVNLLYITADDIYLFNSCAYFVCSLRDAGWFWWAPTAGRFPFEARYYLRQEKMKLRAQAVV